MDPLTILWPPLFSLAIGGVIGLAVIVGERYLPVKEATEPVVAIVTTDGEQPDYCPACLCQFHEHDTDTWHGIVPAGDPILCDDHARRLSKSLDPRTIARTLVRMQHYGLRQPYHGMEGTR